ncbi:MAG: 50S ribosomal protein L4 [Nanoarchaeota archaeon]
MKIPVYDIYGRKAKETILPGFFSENVREDLIWKVLESKKSMQPYGPSLVAGKQHSASGIIRRKRHAWKVSYGYGISRVPRKIISQRGMRFNWIGAEVSSTVGGRRAHPPKTWTNRYKKINKKEEKLALISALAATAKQEYIEKKYSSIKGKKLELPIIIEDSITKVKTKQFLENLKKILNELYDIALPKKSIRSGKGKMRGRKYKKNAGVLIVIGKDEKLKINGIDVKQADKVSIIDLAKGGPGRLTVYTENAVKQLNERVGERQ